MDRLAIWFLGVLASLGLVGCGVKAAPMLKDAPPKRIVSLDYCADQYVLKLVDKDQILAVSPDASSAFSYMRRTADGLPSVSPRAEDVLALQPDLIVRAHGGGPNAATFFEQAGIPVLNVGYASDFAGIRSVLLDMADGLHAPGRGAELAADFDRRLAQLSPAAEERAALYMTPSGVTAGPGSLIHEMLETAGFENFQHAPGWQDLPLERLAYEQPDLVAAAFFNSHNNYLDRWSAMRHPIARAQLENRPIVPLDGAWAACGGWFILDAVEALAEARSHAE